MNEPLDEPGVLDAADVQILTGLREIHARLDPVPAALAERIKYAMTVRLLEAEVAELTRMPMAAVRSESGERFDSISFSGSRLSLMVSLSAEPAEPGEEDAASRVRVDCWVSVGAAVVEIRPAGGSPGQARSEVCDEHGRCVFGHVPRGPAHLIVWASAQKESPPTITPTIEL